MSFFGRARPSPNSVQKGGKHTGKVTGTNGRHAKEGCLDVVIILGGMVSLGVYGLVEVFT